MELIIGPGGNVRCIYREEIDPAALGSLAIRKARHVEPTADGRWLADLSPVGGPCGSGSRGGRPDHGPGAALIYRRLGT